jgi:hypothetical protein
MPKAAREALARMSEDELAEMILRLGRYALRESNRLRWRTGDSVELPGGETIDSIVSLALEKTLSGDRRWDPKAQPKLQEYLMDVIDSLLNHLATGKENSLFIKASPVDGAIDPEGGGSAQAHGRDVDWLVRGAISPEALLLRKEEEQLHERALELLLAECDGDPVLVRIIEVMLQGHDKADRIAAAAGINIREVYNAMKRLDRKAAHVSSRIGDLSNAASGQN